MSWLERGTPQELRARMRELVTDTPEWGGVDEQSGSAELFLALLASLVFATGEDDPQTREVVEETAPLLARVRVGLMDQVSRTESILYDPWIGPEWQEVCERRSALEFLLDLYRDRGAGEALEAVDLRMVDDLLRQRAPGAGPVREDLRPERIPPHHWWWLGEPPS